MIYYRAEFPASLQVCSAAFSPIFRQPQAVIMGNSVVTLLYRFIILYTHNNTYNVISTVVHVSSSPADSYSLTIMTCGQHNNNIIIIDICSTTTTVTSDDNPWDHHDSEPGDWARDRYRIV